ncbi:hypothetical protein C1646_755428 [Rhizophagus diaphanus]|nr:hypothetical protein C1646_755428 [Rhizophagus diaphanus] [Rhizophagus sp. MUCL 43196]
MSTAFTSLELNINLAQSRKRRKGEKSFDNIWNYIIMGDELNADHYKATCYHCNKVCKPSILKAYLVNNCSNVPEDIRKYWRDKLTNNDNTYIRSSYSQLQPLPLQISNRINQFLLKAWIMGGIPFEVIKNPFVVDLFKELNPAYILPFRITLSERLLNEKVACVQKDINNDLKNTEHLTLSTIYLN